jgi:hypothetical protein
MDIVINYAVLIVGIGIIGMLWAIIGGQGKRKSVIQLTSAFVAWGIICYTIQLSTGISVGA